MTGLIRRFSECSTHEPGPAPAPGPDDPHPASARPTPLPRAPQSERVRPAARRAGRAVRTQRCEGRLERPPQEPWRAFHWWVRTSGAAGRAFPNPVERRRIPGEDTAGETAAGTATTVEALSAGIPFHHRNPA
ncbi:hypothetical protein GCM10010349_09200 [Streptomyces flavofungini]|nr:hypothetical protein GCM10010349_09200 [Streptomyces flavofungini]